MGGVSRKKKYEDVPLFHPDTGKAYDRRKYSFDSKTRKMVKLVATKKREPQELPTCKECVKKGKSRANKVRTDAFGHPLAECKECIATPGGKALSALADMPRLKV